MNFKNAKNNILILLNDYLAAGIVPVEDLKKNKNAKAKFVVVISSSTPLEKVKKIIMREVCTTRISWMRKLLNI